MKFFKIKKKKEETFQEKTDNGKKIDKHEKRERKGKEASKAVRKLEKMFFLLKEMIFEIVKH